MQFGIPGCDKDTLSVILWLILKRWWEESTVHDSVAVSRVDVSIDGVWGAPDQKNGYKGYAIYLEHGKLMPHLLLYNQFLHKCV